MPINRIVFISTGGAILASLVLAQIHSPNWLWLTAFAAVSLLQSAFTGFCPLTTALKRLGVGIDQPFDIRSCGGDAP